MPFLWKYNRITSWVISNIKVALGMQNPQGPGTFPGSAGAKLPLGSAWTLLTKRSLGDDNLASMIYIRLMSFFIYLTHSRTSWPRWPKVRLPEAISFVLLSSTPPWISSFSGCVRSWTTRPRHCSRHRTTWLPGNSRRTGRNCCFVGGWLIVKLIGLVNLSVGHWSD